MRKINVINLPFVYDESAFDFKEKGSLFADTDQQPSEPHQQHRTLYDRAFSRKKSDRRIGGTILFYQPFQAVP